MCIGFDSFQNVEDDIKANIDIKTSRLLSVFSPAELQPSAWQWHTQAET